ncbi:Anthocyanin bHLH transcription factor [Quillaja saponaria]|uniref:Anthocyanin bHLH transcription factor n=1 Tax=Quillaja saponaria TaxID=32244 RepID=A0AAD7L7U5_QUISA|nr:Anthocyanin bHLH transcription factor [Quillaja saponaria]
MSGVEMDTGNEKDLAFGAFEQDVSETTITPEVGYEANQPEEDSYMDEMMNGGASQVQSWKIMDDEWSMDDNEVQVELVCPWREGVLLEIMEALSSLHLDCHSFQSSTVDGILYQTIKFKIKGSTVPSAIKIRAAWKQ